MSSRTITPIEGTNGRFEWYQYNDDLRIIHCKDDDTFHAGSIIKALGSTKRVNNWLRNDETVELMRGFMSMREFAHTQLTTKHETINHVHYIKGTYIHRLLVNHFAIWVSPMYAYKISVLLDDHFELQRRVEENRALDDRNKSLEQKVDEQTVEIRHLVDINRKMCNQLETIKVTLSTLVENVSELKNHVTSNKLCRYIIVLYRDDEHSDSEFVVIKPFCGLRENRPKIDQSTILFEREVSCSIDSFKETLSVLEERYIVRIHYRSITIRRYRLEEFVDEFKVELRRKTANINDVCDKITALNDNIVTLNTNVADIAKRLARYQPFVDTYKVPWEMVESIGKSELMYPYNGERYEVHLRTATQIPFIKIGGKIRVISVANFRKAFL